MQTFTYENPTRVHFGKGVIGRLGDELKAMGAKRVLLVYGKGSLKASGVYDAISAQLAAAGVHVVEHAGVSGNPLLSHVRVGIELVRNEQVDTICAAGGGSVMDESKAIAAGALASGDVWDFFCGKGAPTRMLPLLTICTLPATGSEMNGICVVTNEETRQKSALVKPGILNPLISFLDPETTMSLSPTQTAYACTDILSHVMEAYFTTTALRLPLQDNLMEGVCRATTEAMASIISNPADYKARATFMWSATMAWSGIIQAGIPAPSMPCHALEMPISGVYNVAHGAGLSIVIPAWLEIMGEQHKARIAQFTKTVLGENCTHTIKAGEMFRRYYRLIGSPVTFKDAGIESPDLDLLTGLAAEAFAQRGMNDYSTDVIRKIYNACVS